jgi:hypothetical protein
MCQADSYQSESKKFHIPRPMSRRQTLDTDITKMHQKRIPTTAAELSSGSGAPRGDSEALEGPTNTQTAVGTDDPNDVGNKIKGMLAASESLKPGSTQIPKTAERKQPRAVSASIMRKLSNTVAKLKPKTSKTA